MASARLPALYTALIACLAVVGCTSGPRQPEIEAVQPDRVPSSGGQITVVGRRFYAVITANYDDPASSKVDAAFAISISSDSVTVELAGVTLESNTQLSARIEPGAPVGTYDLALEDPRGRVSELPDALVIFEDTGGTVPCLTGTDCTMACAASQQCIDGWCLFDKDDDDDGYVDIACGGSDCDDDPSHCGPLCNPSLAELCDGEDNDCDDTTADGSDEVGFDTVCDGPDTDECAEGFWECDGTSLYCSDTSGNTLDLCGGGDDDCNPLTPDGSSDPAVGAPCDGNGDGCWDDLMECQGGGLACSVGPPGCTGSVIAGMVFEDTDFDGTPSGFDGGVNDAPLPMVDVELYSVMGGGYQASTFTDGNGRFRFTGVSDGNYVVRARAATIGDPDTPPAVGFVEACTVASNPTNPGAWSCALPELVWAHGAERMGGASVTALDTDWAAMGGRGDSNVDVSVAGSVIDVDFGFSYDLITTCQELGQGSLRQFIDNANAIAGPNSAIFRITNGASLYLSQGTNFYWRIDHPDPLPILTDDGTTIDGTTQTDYAMAQGYAQNDEGPEIHIRGLNGGWESGLRIQSSGNTIRDLMFTQFDQGDIAGIDIVGPTATNNTVTGCYIGTDVPGAASRPNLYGIRISGGARLNTIGGVLPEDRNVISGNTTAGVVIEGAGTSDNTVIGNFIGTDADGDSPLPNAHGVWINLDAHDNVIGGAASGAGNLISGNTSATVGEGIGVVILGSDNNRVIGNIIGTDETGLSPLGNDLGVHVYLGSTGNEIGGTAIGEGNIIAHSTELGVYVGIGASATRILGNSIFSNSQWGIDLEPVGPGVPTVNGGKQPPTIDQVVPGAGVYTVYVSCETGDLVELFCANNPAAPVVLPDPTGSGQGYALLGRCWDNGSCEGPHMESVSDSSAIDGTLELVLYDTGLGSGDTLTATATDTDGNSTEFATNVNIP